jgi:DhnA family fructose-bisphosphate aldolase class Ia
MDGKSYRLREFISPRDGRSLILDLSAGLALGPLPGFERFPEAVAPLLPHVDGLVCSPGQAGRVRARSQKDAALLVRASWTNALRGPDFVLPLETVRYIPILSAQEGLDVGACALVLDFLLGYEEEIEGSCLRATVQLALEGNRLSMPVLVQVRPSGPRVALRDRAIALGVSYALEGGADGVALPWPGQRTCADVVAMAGDRPLWIVPASPEQAGAEAAEALAQGACGIWLDPVYVGAAALEGLLFALRAQVHPEPSEAGR